MAVTPDATQAAIVGAIASLLTIGLSKWLDATSADRRDQANARREADREAKNDLALCEITCERLREKQGELLSERAYLRGLLAAHDVTIPTDRRMTE